MNKIDQTKKSKSHSAPNTEKLVELITDIVEPDFRNNVQINLNHQTNLIGTKSRKKITLKKKKIKSKTLTRKEYAKLGLFTIPTAAIRYQDLIPLHQLWKQYMHDHLGLTDRIVPQCDSQTYENFSKLLVKSDFHGAKMKVTRSRCPSFVGASGIVAMDTKNTFKIVGKDNKLKTIPKQDSVFQIHLDNLEFTIFGKHLAIRPAERSVKKVKNFMDPDL